MSAEPVDSFSRMTGTRARRVGALVALAGLALLPSLLAPFIADDYFHVVVASRLGVALTRGWVLPFDLGGTWWTPHGLTVDYFRPLVVLSFAVDALFYGIHAAGYHLTNLALHATATLLTWAIARRVLGPGFAAWGSAALFAVHPCHVQAVGWISGRTDVIAALLFMAAFLLYLESRRRTRAALPLIGLSLAVFVLALLAKEMAITFPAVVLGHSLLRPEGESLPRRLVVPVLAAAIGGLYVALRVTVLGGFHAPPTPFAYHLGDPGLLHHLLSAPVAVPWRPHDFAPADPMVTVPFWGAHPVLLVFFAGIVISIFSALVRRVPDRNAVAWGLGWMGVTFLPMAMLTVGEHFLYLPSVGYCILVGAQLPRLAADLEESLRKEMAVTSGLVLAVCVGRAVFFDVISLASWRTIEEAATTLDGAPDTKLLLVTDLPTGASLGFALGLQFARPARRSEVKVEILNIMPSLTSFTGARSQVTFASQDRLEVQREGGFLTSYVERAFAGSRTSFRAGETFERPGHTVTVLDAPDGRIRAFETHLLDPTHTLVLGESAHGLVPLTPGARPL